MTVNDAIRESAWRLYRTAVSVKVGLPLALVLLALGGVLGYRQSRLAGVPDLSDHINFEKIGRVEVDPARNAAADYEAAFLLLSGTTRPSGLILDPEIEWNDVPPEAQQWLSDHEHALDLWREGTEKEYYLRVQPIDLTLENEYAWFDESRSMLVLAPLAAKRAESEGDFEEAWNWSYSLFRFSRHLGMFGASLDRELGVAAHGLAVDGITRWSRQQELTSSECEAALERVRAAMEMTAGRSTKLVADYFVKTDMLNHLEMFRESFEPMQDTLGYNPVPHRTELFLANEPELTRRLLQHQLLNLLEFIDLTEVDRPPLMRLGEVAYFDAQPSGESPVLAPDEFRHAIGRRALGEIFWFQDRPGSRFDLERTRQTLLECVLAVHWHLRSTGRCPDGLAELVELGLFAEVPTDLLSPAGEPIRYQRDPNNEQRAKVWSIGANGVDEGGEFEGGLDLGYEIDLNTD